MLDILGKSKEPKLIQKHIRKFFEGIQTLVIKNKETEDGLVTTGGISHDGEILPFVKLISLKGRVEHWMESILIGMRNGLQCALHDCIYDKKGNKQKDEWVKKWQGQVTITAGCIAFTKNCSNILESIKKGTENRSLRTIKKKLNRYIHCLSNLVCDSQMGKINHSKTVALITLEIYHRDVLEKLIKCKCKSVQDFAWLSQLRFGFNNTGKCFVKQMNFTIAYNYEYQGNNGRLVGKST